ncbi:MAG: NUDIX hydrolase [Bacteroidales bacterium]
MNDSTELLQLAKRVQALAENGLHYTENDYDIDRYQDLEAIALKMLSLLGGKPLEEIRELTTERNGYRTPKVDVRCVVFNESNEILMVRERIDGCWSLPGGWCDVGFTPSEIAVKETREEAGIEVKAGRLLAIFDKKCHPHPPELIYTYKLFMECIPLTLDIQTGMETLDVGFFSRDNLPELSTPRNTRNQIEAMFEFREGRHAWPMVD